MTYFCLIDSSDFFQFLPVSFTSRGDITFFTQSDEITLEYDDQVELVFTPNDEGIISQFENEGEYVRNTAIVKIIDNNCKLSYGTVNILLNNVQFWMIIHVLLLAS